MKRILTILGIILSLACLLLFARTVCQQWSSLKSLTFDINDGFLLGSGVFVYVVSYLATSRGWQLLLRIDDVSISYHRALCLIVSSQLGKYLPGNIGQHIGRIVLAKKVGIDSVKSISSMVLETITVIVAACVCSLSALYMLPDISSQYGVAVIRSLEISGVVLLIVSTLAITSRRLRYQLGLGWGRVKSMISDSRALMLLSYATLLQVLNFFLGTISIWLVISVVSDHVVSIHVSLVGIYAISWLAGFIVPGAPAGLGVREALLVFGLTPLYGLEVAIASTALFRFVTVLGDGSAFALGLTLSNKLSTE